MSLHRRRVFSVVLGLMVAFAGLVRGEDNPYDVTIYREVRDAKRQQVAEVCGLWFRSWRSGSVGSSYLSLSERYERINTAQCSPALRSYVGKAGRSTTEIAEIFGHGVDGDAVFRTGAYSAGATSPPSAVGERTRRVLEIMRELSAEEDSVVRELNLDR